MPNAISLLTEIRRRERRVHALAAVADQERLTLQRAARRFAGRLLYELGRPKGLAACFAAGCIVGTRRRAAGPVIAFALSVGQHAFRNEPGA